MTTYSTLEIQKRLIQLGFSVGDSGADGVMGRDTIKGIKAFQSSRGLSIDGVVGPNTASQLWPDVPSPKIIPPWVAEAERYLGLEEHKDAKVLNKVLNLNAAAIPWCGAFVNMIITTVLPHAVIPNNPLWALNWLKFGEADASTAGSPHFGAIAVFSRNGGGHVGFAVGHDATYVHVLGGNQSNKVSLTRVKKEQLSGYRKPTGYVFTGAPMGLTKFTGEIFNNAA